jgi:hypothetical protein
MNWPWSWLPPIPWRCPALRRYYPDAQGQVPVPTVRIPRRHLRKASCEPARDPPALWRRPVRHRLGTGPEMRNAGLHVTPRLGWWSMLDLNQRPPACEAGALPTELIDRDERFYVLAGSASTAREGDVPENVPESFFAASCRSVGLTMW